MDEKNRAQLESLFDLPEYEAQNELMEFPSPVRQVNSDVELPIARVLVDAPGALWNPVFDYEIPPKLSDALVSGVRVKVPFNHARVDGIVVARVSDTHILHALKKVECVVSPYPILQPEILALCTELAQEYAVPLMDILRFALPLRHARAERDILSLAPPVFNTWSAPLVGVYAAYANGSDTLQNISERKPLVRRIIPACAHSDATLIRALVQAALAVEQQILIIAPTPARAHTLVHELQALLAGEPIAYYGSDLSTEERYKVFLASAEGRCRVVVGTRSAAFLAMPHLGMCVCVEPEHSSHQEIRSPYFDSARVLLKRALLHKNCHYFEIQRGPRVAAAAYEESGIFAPPMRLLNEHRRSLSPRIMLASEIASQEWQGARLPDAVFTTIRAALQHGDVLISIPHAGYVSFMSCARCGQKASCSQCGGHIEIPQPDSSPQCMRCGFIGHTFECPHCHFTKLKPGRIGSQRTAQDIGRAFPRIPIVMAREESLSPAQRREHSIVIATPGVAFPPEQRFSAAVILDAHYLLRQPSLDAEERFLESLAYTASFVDPRSFNGSVLVVGDIPEQLIQYIRSLSWHEWEQETLSERAYLHLPPASTWVACEGEHSSLKRFLSALRGAYSKNEKIAPVLKSASAPTLDPLLVGGVHHIAPHVSVLGPTVRADGTCLVYLTTDRNRSAELSQLVRTARQDCAATRSPLRIKIRFYPRT